jgi:hypothetical protein
MGMVYDDNVRPTKITVCPQACAAIQGNAMAKIDIYFGCPTVIVPALDVNADEEPSRRRIRDSRARNKTYLGKPWPLSAMANIAEPSRCWTAF